MLLLTGISRRQGRTQCCYGVILHQFHWVDSEGTLPLIGCWAVITTSNNDRYFKENRESWKEENWQWYLFFLGILFSIFWVFFWQYSYVFLPVYLLVYLLRMQSSCDLCQSTFFYNVWIQLMSGAILLYRGVLTVTCLDESHVGKFNHKKFN